MNKQRYNELLAHRRDCFAKIKNLLHKMETHPNQALPLMDTVELLHENMLMALRATVLLQEVFVYDDALKKHWLSYNDR